MEHGDIKRILFATDFSDCAEHAQAYAWWLAAACRADVEILHVVEFQPGLDPDYPVNQQYLDYMRSDARSRLERIRVGAAHAGLTVLLPVLLGVPSQRILQTAARHGADLIVLGTHGRTGLEHVLLGSTAERVVQGAPCPVLTVRAPRTKGRPGVPSLSRILVPTDFSECSQAAVEHAVRLAGRFQAEVTLLHVLEPQGYGLDFTLVHAAEGPKLRETTQQDLAELAAPLRTDGLTVESLVRAGLPADTILKTAAALHADLIVMGTHGRRGVAHLLSGSVAERVLRAASCPVLSLNKSAVLPRGEARAKGAAGVTRR